MINSLQWTVCARCLAWRMERPVFFFSHCITLILVSSLEPFFSTFYFLLCNWKCCAGLNLFSYMTIFSSKGFTFSFCLIFYIIFHLKSNRDWSSILFILAALIHTTLFYFRTTFLFMFPLWEMKKKIIIFINQKRTVSLLNHIFLNASLHQDVPSMAVPN